MGDDYDKLQVGPGHMIKLPAYVEHNAPKSLIELMESDKAVAEFVHKLSQHSQVEDVAENA
eukprot:CAMPEP_0172477966 /NCGR_PEP_ID=MMETSP1066-20121228/1587_1 /TAXON_ID=671091 /ORGANISM="Coscinodiscus wailesii, Strain CCMP2513" /LENGTH=60 /DNA_ID=CAMNT_0013237057 /DNA_START=6 /DNA_END=188 /DNA_ORIENTATION=+